LMMFARPQGLLARRSRPDAAALGITRGGADSAAVSSTSSPTICI
jgi:hypothetical protein